MPVHSGVEARSLIRLAGRTARQSKARSLLVVALIAIVVAAGAAMMAIGSSSVATDDDLQRRALGDADIAFAFSSDGHGYFDADVEFAEILAPAPIPGAFSMIEDESAREEIEAAQQAIREWNAGFDAEEAIAVIEGDLNPPSVIRYTRSIAPGWGQVQSCPFGCGSQIGLAIDISAFDPVAAGQVVVLDGRLPAEAGEVARDIRSVSSEANTEIGDTVVSDDGVEFTIVGTYGQPSQLGPSISLVTAVDFDRIAAANPEAPIEYRLYPEAGWQPADRLATLRMMTEVVDQSVRARTADEILLPVEAPTPEWVSRPVMNFRTGADRVEARALPAMVTVLLSVQIAFVAAAALAVAVRRRSHQYALVGVAGGSPMHVRGLVFAEALLLGVTGAIIGIVVAALAVRFFPYEAPLASGWFWNDVELGIIDALVPAAIGIGAALVAAWWPAHIVATSPTTALLGGRLPSRRPGAPTLRRAGALLAIGSVMTVLLSVQFANSSSSTLLPLAALAILTMLGGAALAIGPILAGVGRRSDRLPLLARLVARDSDRGRTRSWVAIGALMVLTMIPVLIGAATKAYPNSFGDNNGELDERLVAVRTQHRWWGPPNQVPQTLTRERLADYNRIDDAIAVALADVGRIAAEVDLVDLPDVDVVVRPSDQWSTSSGDPVIVATPELVEAFGLDDESRKALAAGDVLDVGRYSRQQGPAFLERQGSRSASVATDVVRGPIYFSNGVLVSPDHPIVNVVEPQVSGTFRVMAEPLSLRDQVAVQRAGNDAWKGVFANGAIPAEEVLYGTPMSLIVEQAWGGGSPDASTVRLWALAVAGALSLLIAILMAALSAVELDRDLSSMIAAGAPPSLRRRFLGAHTLYHMVIAALLGVPLATLLYWLATRADDFGPSGPTVPWTVVAIVALVIPIVVAALVALFFRSGRPSVSRRMT